MLTGQAFECQRTLRVCAAVFGIYSLFATPSFATEVIPLVGCGGKDMGEDHPPPEGGQRITLAVRHQIAQNLAIYHGETGSILGPRGWKCGSIEVSSGEAYLGLAPNAKAVNQWEASKFVVAFTAHQNPVHGEENSVVAAYMRRYFRETNRESFFFIPHYPNDVLLHRGRNLLEFVTAPRRLGLGTDQVPRDKSEAASGRLYAYPTYSLLWFGHETFIHVIVRLPPKLNYLHTIIFRNFVRCVAGVDHVPPLKECIPGSSPSDYFAETG